MMSTRNWPEEPGVGPGQLHDVPDFRWPHRVTELIFEWLSDLWENLRDYTAEHVRHRTMLGRVQVLIALAGIAYLALLWICFCYIRFPVSPYGVWDLAEWVMLAGSVIWGAIAVYFGGALLLTLLWLLFVVAVYFTLSVGYLCWTVWNATLKQSLWLKSYHQVMLFGMLASLALATFADGAYRFWEPPFSTIRWLKFAAVGASAWAALFCHLMQGHVRQRGTPQRIIKWTIGLTVAAVVIVHWHAGQSRGAHFLEKKTIEYPNDPRAWLDLARYYKDEGDMLATDSGDENHGPPDPKPYYEQALDCINRAIDLGATGFDVTFSRAQLADALGNTRAAILFAQETLRFAPVESTPEGKDQITWLNDMMARNMNALAALQEVQREQERQRVRDRRRQRLPRIVRWVFDTES